jgi:acyl-CoA synthetase (AMP-forming)/AMP-acid ligase II
MLPLPRHLLSGPGTSAALVMEDEVISFTGLRDRAEAMAAASLPRGRKALVFCFLGNGLDLVVAYLASLCAGHAVALLPPATSTARLRELVRAYRPEVIFAEPARVPDLALHGYAPGALDGAGDVMLRGPEGGAIHPDLAVLLSTSGSTGTPKLVRLSAASLIANSAGIAEVVGIGPEDLGVTGMPLYHSYGLSVLNSHLAASSAVVLTALNPLSPGFWQAVAHHRVTEIAATPTVHRAIFGRALPAPLPESVRRILQAGARFPAELAPRVGDWMDATAGQFFSMYGQTEATARISCLDPAAFAIRPASVGTALPGGTISIQPGEPGQADGAICYVGPNVMMGYATCRADLASGSEVGVLQTGDIGYLDAAGFLYVTGRASRFTKVLDRRVSLDDVEDWFRDGGPCAAVPADDGDAIVVFTTGDPAALDGARRALAKTLGTSNRTITLRAVDRIPATDTGKVGYAWLEEMARAARSNQAGTPSA